MSKSCTGEELFPNEKSFPEQEAINSLPNEHDLSKGQIFAKLAVVFKEK
jgi:hypothetical protein